MSSIISTKINPGQEASSDSSALRFRRLAYTQTLPRRRGVFVFYGYAIRLIAAPGMMPVNPTSDPT